jgi:osmotically-inducible protein OsmY
MFGHASASTGADIAPTSEATVEAAMKPANEDTLALDLAITRRIRREVQLDRRVAHPAAIQITSKGGFVTLTGSVRNSAERQILASKAKAVVGTANVTDALTIDSKKGDLT